ncbi:uncharacterized protein LOC121937150 [Sceloporus undulatus]|uniref:uncharacterized protein LOC121937150 n=1 Tax=Sceloporus undulatus TaxID=8520 RepID=UPI001C4BEF6B|nr:uncharacterized protein LOC121937150 [Sceloporus undulatus]
MASAWGYMKTARQFIKKNVCKPVKKSVCKAARRLCSCVRPSKHEEDPGFPEVNISHAEEGNPEMLAAESLLSLTDNEGVKETPLGTAGKEKDDGEKINDKGSVNSSDLDNDAEADFNLGSISDSLEGIPDMLAAESLPLLMDNGEVKEAPLGAAEKEKDDGEKMNDEGSVNSRDLDGNACPGQAECNPGPSSNRYVLLRMGPGWGPNEWHMKPLFP